LRVCRNLQIFSMFNAKLENWSGRMGIEPERFFAGYLAPLTGSMGEAAQNSI
jgi:hypothetical protein